MGLMMWQPFFLILLSGGKCVMELAINTEIYLQVYDDTNLSEPILF